MYSVHGLKKGHFLPLVFALFPGKSEHVYKKNLWDCILSACSDIQLQLQPHVIHNDFAVAMHNVLKAVFPESVIKCCRFHLGVEKYRLWAKVQITRTAEMK